MSGSDLRGGREAGTHLKPSTLPRLVFRHLRRNGWTRDDDAHLAAENVDELRELVNAELANEATDACYSRVARHLEDRPGLLVVRHQLGLELLSVGNHRAKLEHVKLLPMLTNAQLPEKNRAARSQLDEHSDHDHERGKNQQRDRR